MIHSTKYIATVAICSYINNEPSRLLESTLESILNNAVDDILIYVVLDGCSQIPAELTRFNKNNVVFSISLDKQGIAKAREECIKNALGEYILFCDDDCIVDQNWIRNMISYMSSNNKIAAGGLTLPLYTNTTVEKYIDFEQAQREPLKNKDGVIFSVSTVNAIFRLKSLNQIDCFTPVYKRIYELGYFPGLEDFDISYRIREFFGEDTLGFCYNGIVHHHNRKTLKSRCKQYYYYGNSAVFWGYSYSFKISNFEAGYPFPDNPSIKNLIIQFIKQINHHRLKAIKYYIQLNSSLAIKFTYYGISENIAYYRGANRMYKVLKKIDLVIK